MVDSIENRIPPEISGTQSREVHQIDRRKAEDTESKREIQGDETTLSKEARLLQRVRQALDEVPDVRKDKVEALRRQIQDGSYEIDVENLIDALLGRQDTGVGSG